MSRTLYVVKFADCDDPWLEEIYLERDWALREAKTIWRDYMWVRVVERRGKNSRVIWEDGDAQ